MTGKTRESEGTRHARRPPDSLPDSRANSTANSTVGARADATVGLLRAALEPRPDDVERLIRGALATGRGAAPRSRRPRWWGRHPRLALGTLTVVLAVVVGGIAFLSSREGTTPAITAAAATGTTGPTGATGPTGPTGGRPSPPRPILVGTGSSIAIQDPPGAALRESAGGRGAVPPAGSFILLRRLDS